MTTYRELVYMCLDLIKGTSDDFTYTEEHIVYLLDKYRALLLKQRYGNDPKKYIPAPNYSTVKFTIIDGTTSEESIPIPMNIGVIPRINIDEGIEDFTIEYVVKERFNFVGNSKYLKNIKYCTISNEGFLEFKNPISINITNSEGEIETIHYTGSATITAILETPLKEAGLDSEFPLEESLIPNLIQMVLKDLLPASYRPEDNSNNATDDMATLAGYLSKVLKKPYTQNLTVDDIEDE